MKKLIIVSHPNIEKSEVNKRWIEELEKYTDDFTIHKLYSAYPDGKIDIEKEHKILEAHDTIIFQFPFYWFSTPPLLKQWMDEVLIYGWAFGSTGDKMKNKAIALAISVGVHQEDYEKTGKNKVTMEELLSPLIATALYIDANYKAYFAFYGAEHNPSVEALDQSARDYVDFAMNIN